MEGEKLTGDSNPAAPELDENEATSIGEIIASLVAELGADKAWLWNNEVRFGSRASGRPGSLSVVRPNRTVGFADDHDRLPEERSGLWTMPPTLLFDPSFGR